MKILILSDASFNDSVIPLLKAMQEKNNFDIQLKLLDEKESVVALLDSLAIEGIPFRDVIMDDETVMLGQD